ncbi:unnamed protein product [Sphenostylis stenocarpa]|uniref:Uncharacterized protein n=1 Tax=Sphenostylis stenocarpa TaxID=92480 RepID=A0AA86VMA7_9FABA|nr:unnamed protein product [Sphenostylis stenocarpa]
MEHTRCSTRNNNTLHNDVYFQKGVSIPFSWEYKPGLPKITHQKNDSRCSNIVLQPPPCSSSRTAHNKQEIPVEVMEAPDFILCAVQPSFMKNRSFRLESQTEDPFVEAYKKCTETPKNSFMRKQSTKSNKSSGSWPNIMKYKDIFSCKFSIDVMSTV